MHEYRNLERETVTIGSNKSFGLVFCVFFALIAFAPLVSSGQVRPWALMCSLACAVLAFFCPHALRPLNMLWMRLGLLLHHVTTPFLMGLVFFCVLTPIGLVMRIVGKNPLSLKYSNAESYWLERRPPGPEPESFKQQF